MNACIRSIFLFALALPVAAEEPKAPEMTPEQQAMMDAWIKAGTPGAPHENLKAFVGNWDTKVTAWMDPSAPPETSAGKATYTLTFGGRYLHTDYKGDYHGQPFEGFGQMGYDNVTGKYWSTWTDSMSTGIFVETGDYDAATKTYTMNGPMHDPTVKTGPVPVRTVTRFVDADHHTFEFYETRDGKERKTMEMHYTRAK